ncbi:MAG: ester cyclase [Anaerolineales bacterium]|jgi:predicted ester cyclase
MNVERIAEEFLAALNAGNIKECRSYLADKFSFNGPVPEPISADEWMDIIRGMRTAFPDLNYNGRIACVQGEKVLTTTQLSGTHTGEWDLSAMGIGVLPASGKSFSNPKEDGVMTVQNGKITSYFINAKEGSGMAGILKQIGVEVTV